MKALLDLLRSMRFAIAILAVVAVAATIGSVLEQNQARVVYVSRYGEFLAAFYDLCGLVDVYHAWWFFVLLGFMAMSTALCLWRNTPAMLRDMRSYREQKSLASLRGLEHSVELALERPDAGLDARLAGYLRACGYAFKQVTGDGASLFAARRGAARRIGYLLVHGAMVLICLGGLIDGNVGLRLRLWSGALKLETRELAPADVPAASRLHADAGAFRASMNLPEGDTGQSALLPIGDGYLLQELPFKVRLNRFRIDHYVNGRPKDFASDIEIIDGARVLPVTLQVNRPYTYRGVTLYQSGFADGGSHVSLELLPLAGTGAERIDARIGGASALLLGGEPYTLELSEYRSINVFARDDAPQAPAWGSHAQPGARVRDVGPSLSFHLRDKQGQADDWIVYRQPVALDGASWFLIGHRAPQESAAQESAARESAMQYVRLPADADASLTSYRRFVRALGQPEARRRAAHALVATTADRALAATLERSAITLLDGFAARGYRALADLVPVAASQERRLGAGRLYANVLHRAAANLVPDMVPALVERSLAAYDETLVAGLPALVVIEHTTQVNASGIALTKAPGATLVYLGAALLALGVIAMYFVSERRLWLRHDGSKLLIAFAANRSNPGLQAEFDAHRGAIQSLTLSNR
jgi:cytochrome c biogenesis protein